MERLFLDVLHYAFTSLVVQHHVTEAHIFFLTRSTYCSQYNTSVQCGSIHAIEEDFLDVLHCAFTSLMLSHYLIRVST